MPTEILSIATTSVKTAPDLQKLGKNEIVGDGVGVGGLTEEFLMKIPAGVFLPEVGF